MNDWTTWPDGCARWSGLCSMPPALKAWMAGAALMALAPVAPARAQCEPVEIPGVNGPVHAMVNWDPDGAGPLTPVLVVGGSFTAAGSIGANNIAAWNPATRRWGALGSGMGGSGDLTAVNALAVRPDGTLVAGGEFLSAGGVGAARIAGWNGTAWSALGSGLDDEVRALATLPGGDLAAAGDFWYIARWNGSAWSAVGNASTNGEAFALAVMSNGDLVAGGRFINVGLVAASKIARWNGTAWSALGPGMNDIVTSLAPLPGGELYAGGNFTSAGGQDAFFTARWNGSAWSPLGGLGSNVFALALLPNGNLVAGGNFVVAGSVSALRVARWDGANWSALGSGVNSTVYSLAAQSNGDVMAGGLFDIAGGQAAQHIARWDGLGWSAPTGALVASDAAAGDEFGIAVAVSGDTAVVGARRDDNATGTDAGAAYVYVKSGPGIQAWTQQAKLVPTNSFGLPGSESGISVAISGDRAMVGSWLWPSGNATGFIYIFGRSGPPGGEVWTQQYAYQCPQFGSFQYFGYSLALEGDTAVVGTLASPGGYGGAAFFYALSGPPGGQYWAAQQVHPSDGVSGDQFGNSVAMSPSQDWAAVGAFMEDNAGGTDAGSAYIYARTGIDNSWVEQAKLTASDGAAGDYFGVKVAISGDTAVVGAHGDDNGGGIDAGSVYIFTRVGTVWTQQAKLTASDAAAGDSFGVSLALSGNLLVIGAHADDSAGSSDAGSAYVFRRSGSPGSEVWIEDRKLTASDPGADDWFGAAVAVSGGTAVIGARQDDHAGGINAGSVYVFGLKVCRADYNCDGFVDGIDYDQFNNDFENPDPAEQMRADYNGDGFVDGIDYDMFNNDFETLC